MDINKLIEDYKNKFNDSIPTFLIPNDILDNEIKFKELLNNCLNENKTIKEYLNIDYKPNVFY
jgi:hypothetical protein